jgi:cleavage stimulation factor subunit 2
VTCTDDISRTLNTLPPAQLLDILSQMKALATNEPARATELLTQAPQLSYAIFQALLLMGLVSPEAINSVVDAGAAAGPPPSAAPPPAVPLGYPSIPGYPGAVATGTPPVAAPYQPPPVVPPPAPAPAAPAGGMLAAQDPDALMAMVMQLPQETIDQLPEAERQQVMMLKASYQAQRR